MIPVDIEQGSPEWFSEKAYKPSASCFDKIVTSKGERSAQRKAYLYQLAGESIVGQKVETYQSQAMTRGIEMEPEARTLYEMLTDNEVRQVGCCYKDEKKNYLCSPDGLIDPDGGFEVKCPMVHTHVGYLLKGKLPTAYIQQVQGSMLITGAQWWDFMSYYPELPPLIVRVYPDKEFHEKLEKELNKFVVELEQTIEKLKEL
jgi:hypothetical protein